VKRYKDTAKSKAELIAKAAFDKKADDVVIMDLRKISTICDYFVIAGASSTRRVKAIADNIRESLDLKEHRLWHIEGYNEAQWVVMDYSDAVAHIFYSPLRRFYDLERLWGDASLRHFIPAKQHTKRNVRRKN